MTTITQNMLLERLEQLEESQNRILSKTTDKSVLNLYRKDRVKSLVNRYLLCMENMHGIKAMKLMKDRGSLGRTTANKSDKIDLVNFCIDMELAVESLSWKKAGYSKNSGNELQKVFFAYFIKQHSIVGISRNFGMPRNLAKTLLNQAIDIVYEHMSDYDTNFE